MYISLMKLLFVLCYIATKINGNAIYNYCDIQTTNYIDSEYPLCPNLNRPQLSAMENVVISKLSPNDIVRILNNITTINRPEKPVKWNNDNVCVLEHSKIMCKEVLLDGRKVLELIEFQDPNNNHLESFTNWIANLPKGFDIDYIGCVYVDNYEHSKLSCYISKNDDYNIGNSESYLQFSLLIFLLNWMISLRYLVT